MTEILFGLLLVIISGFLQGTFALFFKFTKPLPWANYWIIYASLAFFLFPTILAMLTVPSFTNVLSASLDKALLPLLFGALWGIGAILFGISVERIGLSLTFSIILGMVTLIGTISPIFINNVVIIGTQLVLLAIGLLIILFGVMVSGYSGVLRDKLHKKGVNVSIIGLLIAVASGLFSPFLNVAFVFGKPLVEVAQSFGASSILATFFVWSIVMFGGFFVNALYAVFLIRKNNSISMFKKLNTKHVFFLFLAAFFWYISNALFGIASVQMGVLGPSVGWGILFALSIVVSNLWGVRFGEWKKAEIALQYQFASITLVLIGIILIAASVLIG